MNERIQELLIEAHRQTKGGIYSGHPAEWSEKFAELIVKECVRYFNEDYQRDFDVKWREDLSIGIKNHFGVEE
jgi:hypothetical protein